MFAANWILAVRGVDVAADARGCYSTKNGAYLLMREHGGLLAMVGSRMLAHGFAQTRDPAAGDIGVVQYLGTEACAIKTKSGWACKSLRGLIVCPFDSVKAWKL